jgi:hypothetical protein
MNRPPCSLAGDCVGLQANLTLRSIPQTDIKANIPDWIISNLITFMNSSFSGD